MLSRIIISGYCLFVLSILASDTVSAAGFERADNTTIELRFLARLKDLKEKSPNEILILGEEIISESLDETNQNLKFKVDVLNELSHAYILTGDYSSSIKRAKEAKLIAENIDYQFGEGLATKNIAHFYLFVSDFETALNYYFQALSIIRQSDKNTETVRILNSISQIYYKIGKVDESISLFEESLNLLNESHNKRDKAYSYGGLAEAYNLKKNFKKSLYYAKQSLKLLKEIDDKAAIIIGYRLLGELQLQKNNFSEANKYFEEAILLAEKNNVYGMFHGPYNLLAKSLFLEKKYVQAEKIASDALRRAEEKNELVNKSESLELLSQIAEAQKKPRLALQYYKQYKEIEHRIFNEKSDRTFTLLRTSFEVDQLDRKNQLLEKQNELIQINIEKEKTQKLIILIFSLLVILSIAFAYYRFAHNKKLQQEKLINEQLQSVNQLKDQILMNTSHEFRTPLTGIIGLAECLRDELMGAQTDEAKENLAMIVGSGRRLNELVDDILNFAQLKSGNFEINISPVDVYLSLIDVVTTCSPLLNEKSITINNTIKPGQFVALADEKRLVQILFNLIGNAIKYSNEGEIKITAEDIGERIKISISDQGIGIPQDKLEFIFEYFEQIDASSRRTQQGSGLGLAIVKKLVELQNGSISVKSILNEGSVFSFTLPKPTTITPII